MSLICSEPALLSHSVLYSDVRWMVLDHQFLYGTASTLLTQKTFIALRWSQSKAKLPNCSRMIKLLTLSIPFQSHTQSRHQKTISASFPSEFRSGINQKPSLDGTLGINIFSVKMCTKGDTCLFFQSMMCYFYLICLFLTSCCPPLSVISMIKLCRCLALSCLMAFV